MQKPKAPFAQCEDCPLCDMPFVPGERPAAWEEGGDSILIVGEAPGENEVNEGRPFVGRAGQLLNQELTRAGIDRADVFVTNAVLCRPPGNQMKNYAEAIDHCRPRLIAEIKDAKPGHVFAMGATALSTLLPEVETSIMATRGLHKFSAELEAEVVVMVHPAFLLRMPNQMLNFRKDLEGALNKRPRVADTNIYLVDTVEKVKSLPAKIFEETALFDPLNEDGAEITCDVETDGLEPYMGGLLRIQMSWKDGESAVITRDMLALQETRDALNEIFEPSMIVWWGHNFSYDYRWLKKNGFNPPRKWWDTMILHYLTDETAGGHGLKDLGQSFLGVEDWEKDIRKYVPKKADSYALIPNPVLDRYAARDTDINRQLIYPVCKEVSDDCMHAYRTVQQPAQEVLAEMEYGGILIDLERLEQMLTLYYRKRNDMLYYMQQMTWPGFNPNSPKQVAEKLFEDEGFKPRKMNKTGPSTDDEVLAELTALEPDNKFLKLLSEYRAIDKVITTYLEGMRDAMDVDGYVHPDFNLIGTVTGRLTAGRYLTLPRITKNRWAGGIRDLVIARPGYSIVGADYNQAELRVMACEAEEDVWKEMWDAGRNIHDEMCRRLFGVGKKEDHEKYMIAKMFTFGLGYGRTPESIALQMHWPNSTAKMFYDRYMDAIPKVKAWQGWIKNEVRIVGYLDNAFGQRRRFPLITDQNRKHVFNEGLNYIPQSTANALALMSMTQYYHELRENGWGRPILMLHDGIYLEIKTEYAEQAGARLASIMQTIPREQYDDYVPFTAEVKIGHSWGESERAEE